MTMNGYALDHFDDIDYMLSYILYVIWTWSWSFLTCSIYCLLYLRACLHKNVRNVKDNPTLTNLLTNTWPELTAGFTVKLPSHDPRLSPLVSLLSPFLWYPPPLLAWATSYSCYLAGCMSKGQWQSRSKLKWIELWERLSVTFLGNVQHALFIGKQQQRLL